MKKTLLIKMFRDLRENIVQFIAIFVMCFVAMFVLAGLEGESAGILQTATRYFEDTNFTDLVVMSEGFTASDVENVRAINSVEDASRRAYKTGKVVTDSGEKKIGMTFIEDNVISTLYLQEGEPYEPGKAGIWIDRHFAGKERISVGDNLTLRLGNATFSETVAGIIDSPDFFYYIIDETYSEPQYGEYCYAYLDTGSYPGNDIRFDRMDVKLSAVRSQLGITDHEKEVLEAVRSEILGLLSNRSLVVATKTEDVNYSMVYGEVEMNSTLATIFPALFVIVALLGIMSTMSRLLERQRMLIGALKALGFSRSTVMVHYMSYIFVITAAACILGSIVGYNTLGRNFSEDMNLYYSNPYNTVVVTPKMVITNFLVVVFAVMTAWLSCRKLLVLNASEILRPAPPVVAGAGFLEKTPLWRHLSFATCWNLRDISRNRMRTAMGVLGVTLSAGLMVAAVGYNEYLADGGKWQYSELTPADYSIKFADGTTYETAYEYAREYAGQLILDTDAELKGRNGSHIYHLTVVDEGNLRFYQNEDFEPVPLPAYGCIMSVKAASVMGLEKGDVIRFRMPGQKKWAMVRIEDFFKSDTAQGIAMSREVYEAQQQTFTPNLLYTNRTVDDSLVDRKEIAATGSKEKGLLAVQTANAALEDIAIIIMVIAVTVCVVVTYNMGVMSFMEKIREIATLKVLGFPTKKIRWILQQQNILITGLGALLGMPLGVEILRNLLAYEDDLSDYVLRMSAVPFVLAFLLSFVLSLAVNGFLSAKVKDIDMVEALKGVE